MAEHVWAPLEDLFRPIEPPPAGLDRPVCKRTHDSLLHSLDVLNNNIAILRGSLEMLPRFDAYIDGLRGNVARALDDAGNAYAAFMETRDCEGEA